PLRARLERRVASEADAAADRLRRGEVPQGAGVVQFQPGTLAVDGVRHVPVEEARHLAFLEGEGDADRRIGEETELLVADEEQRASVGLVHVRPRLLQVPEAVSQSRAQALCDQGTPSWRDPYRTRSGCKKTRSLCKALAHSPHTASSAGRAGRCVTAVIAAQ